jgi:trigger factor
MLMSSQGDRHVKSTVETLSPTRVRLAVEVPYDELKPSLDRAYRSIGKQVRVPGFRPGKVPAAIIDQRVGRGAVLEEAVQDAVPRAYAEAVRSNEVRALGQPEIELTLVDAADGIAFTAEVDVRPEVNLPSLADLAVTVDDVEVGDQDVEDRVGVLREKFAMLKTADRAVQTGDYVTIDLAAHVGEEEIESRAGLSYEVGSGQLISGLDEALVGLTADEERTFETELMGGEHAGETASVSVTLRSVKEKELPELDDDFAQTASEFDTLDELRADIRSKISRLKQVEQGIQARDRVLDALLSGTEVPLPESVVATEQSWRRDSLDQQLGAAGLSLEQYLSSQEQAEEDFDAEIRTASENAVKTQLVLDALADAEQVGVSDQELTEHVMVQAERYGVDPQEFVQRMSESGGLTSLVAEVRRNKALATAMEAATVTDESGRPVDIAALRRGETGEATDDGQTGQDAPEVSAEAGEPATAELS